MTTQDADFVDHVHARRPADLLRTSATVVWVVLIGATLLSWVLGTGHGIGGRGATSITILVIAFAKVRFIALYFMELKDAPLPLRALIEAYCLVVCLLLIGFYSAG